MTALATGPVTGPGLYADVDFGDYQSDALLPAEYGRSLSQSGGKTLLRSPAKFAWERDNPTPSTPAMELGTAVHALLFETAPVAAFPAGDGRTKAVKEARAAALLAADEVGTLLLPADQYEVAVLLADAVRTHPTAARMLTGGVAEHTAYWVDQDTGVTCRARLDYYAAGRAVFDVKTAIDASRSGFSRAAAKFGYHLQDVWYRTAIRQVTDEELPFVFVVVEKAGPWQVAIYQLDADAAAAGEHEMRRALALYAECESNDRWPGYPADLQTLSLPPWALGRPLEEL